LGQTFEFAFFRLSNLHRDARIALDHVCILCVYGVHGLKCALGVLFVSREILNYFMPFSPSDLEWWQWALCGVGAVALCAIFYGIALAAKDDDNKGCAISVVFLVGLAAIPIWIIALVRFVKWIWNG
jgi:hypothetical protein